MDINDLALARVLHIIGVVLWIGGVAMVTTVLLPSIRKLKNPEERVIFFETIEKSFAIQAKLTTVLTGATGFYMLYALNAWGRYLILQYWWIHAMTAVWLVFTIMLFILEPLFLHNWFIKKAKLEPEKTFSIVFGLHIFLLSISLITIFGSAAGAHGWFFF
ncbi:MAG: hypothetical protein H7A23_05340 [Leptospiraceae bacterium]|nr:hypothetical protein [Leptospiraceae bacterium]MCP5493960.1 hypothetical protein [Leptospiraceae bacterium]